VQHARGIAQFAVSSPSKLLAGGKPETLGGQHLTDSNPTNTGNPAERRKTARFPFIANAEVTDTGANAKINARVSELSINGCYVDMLNPLPAGTLVFIKIFTETDFFEASASVVYSHPHLGIGLAFRNVSAHFLPTLQKWLREAVRPNPQ